MAILLMLASCVRPGDAQTVAASRAALDEAEQLDQQIGRLYEEGKLRASIPLAERALVLREHELGPTHPLVADSLTNLGELWSATGAYDKAEPLLRRALDLREDALDPAPLEVAASLDRLAAVYRAQGAYANAEPLLTRAVDLRERALEQPR